MPDTAAGDLPPLDLTYARLLLAAVTDAAASCGHRMGNAEHPRISTECIRPANHDGPHSDRVR